MYFSKIVTFKAPQLDGGGGVRILKGMAHCVIQRSEQSHFCSFWIGVYHDRVLNRQ